MEPTDDSQEREDDAFARGEVAVYRRLLSMAIRGMGVDKIPDDADRMRLRIARLEAEMADARVQLRKLCEDFGDTDWGDSLYLADVIERYLGRALYESKKEEDAR